MLLSFNWFKKFVDIPKDITPEKLGELLTLSTVEVETVRRQGELLNKVVVGKVVKLESHPNADKLKLAHVQTSSRQAVKPTKVVCGGVNLRVGMSVAFAKVGARVKWHGAGEPVILKKAKIRGLESSGMICSASELELENIFPQESEEHIIDLSNVKNLKIGQPLALALGLNDTIIEIENKSLTNRPDLWSHYGMAREIAALTGSKLKTISSSLQSFKPSSKDKLTVEIRANQKCPRYLGVVLDNIKIESSPMWLARQLEAIGIRAINNIVDITNYVLMELGQPLHAFDFARLATDVKTDSHRSRIIVRRAKLGEKITTLDGVERKLTADDLVIADSKKPVALAGVMGGANSEISDKTQKIIIESANFEPSGIRRTESRTGLRTEASIRFEKALDPELAEPGIKRALKLILQFCPQARVASPIIDVGTYKPKKRTITLDLNYLNRLIGEDIPVKRVTEILESLGFKITPQALKPASPLASLASGADGHSSRQAVKLQAEVPTFRATRDITLQEDLIEEVARIYGYQNLKPEMPSVKLTPPQVNTERQLERQIKNILTTGFGFTEVQNYSFIDLKLAAHFGYEPKDLLALANPITPEQSYLRPSLLINLTRNVKDNLRFFNNFKLFEIGRTFTCGRGQFNTDLTNKEFLPRQDKFLSGVIVSDNGFAESKSALENLLEQININYQLTPTKTKVPWAESERLLEVKSNNRTLGYIAELCPHLRLAFKLTQPVAAFELNFTLLATFPKQKTKEFKELPIYPAVTRDLAIVITQGIMYKDIADTINSVSPLIVALELFDVYTGRTIGPGKWSLAFHLTFRAPDRTLESEEVDKIFGKVVKKLEEKFRAKLRDF